MKTIAVIPARGGSKRLPGKNIRLLGEIPLLVHSILYAKANSEIVDDVYVSTDDIEIKRIALQFGAMVIDRPNSLAGDLDPTASVLRHVLQSIDSEVENVILLQATNPLRPDNLLKEAFEIFRNERLESLFTVSQSHQKLGKIINNKFHPFNYSAGQRSQDLEPLYYENGLLYIAKAGLILNDVIISECTFPFVVDHLYAKVDIDTIEDFLFAEYILHKDLGKYSL